MSQSTKYISASEAIKLLGITSQTLYSYVSRGYIESILDPNNRKKRRYRLSDIERLLLKKGGESTEKISQFALNWGSPVLSSALTLIENNKLYYRGKDVADLLSKDFETVTYFLWTGEFHAEKVKQLFYNQENNNLQFKVNSLRLQTIQSLLLQLEILDDQAYDLQDQNIHRIGANILRTTITTITEDNSELSISRKLARYFGKSIEEEIAYDLINTTLILLADHELNSSSFTARNVASAGSTLYQSMIAGISSLLGFRHGGSIFRIQAMISDILSNGKYKRDAQNRLRRGELFFGYGHNLYPNGDYRAVLLLGKLKHYFQNNIRFETLMKVNSVCMKYSGQSPNIDFALYVMSQVFKVEVDFAQFVFMIGRMAGWVGHALEQYAENKLLRPRAKYIGVSPP